MDAPQRSPDMLENRQSVISSANVEETKVDAASIDVLSMPLMDKTPILSNMLGHAMYTGLVIPSPEQGRQTRRSNYCEEPPRKIQIFNPADQFRYGEDYRRVPLGGVNW